MSRNKEKGGCGSVIFFAVLFLIIRGWFSGGDDTDNTQDYVDDRAEIEIAETTSNSLVWKSVFSNSEDSYKGSISISSQDYYNSKDYKSSYFYYKYPYIDPEGNWIPDMRKFYSNIGQDFLKNSNLWDADVSDFSAYDSRWEYVERIGLKEGYSYKKSHLFDRFKLDFVYSMFDEIQEEHGLSRYDFAHMIVSFVQTIDYSLPMINSCDLRGDLYGSWAQEVDCDSYIPFGWYTPTEFMLKWTGDCDTRSLFLFTVLTHYRYDVVMLNSDEYKHAILGINLVPEYVTNPLYKEYNFKKYYAWEVTAEWPLGMLAPDQKNMRNWTVVLDNDLNCPVSDRY